MLSAISKELNQTEMAAIKEAEIILRDASCKLNELFYLLSENEPSSDVTYEIIQLSNGTEALNRYAEMLLTFAKSINRSNSDYQHD